MSLKYIISSGAIATFVAFSWTAAALSQSDTASESVSRPLAAQPSFVAENDEVLGNWEFTRGRGRPRCRFINNG